MAEVIAVDADGELSRSGFLTNTLFTHLGTTGKVGDVGAVTVKLSEPGFSYPDYYLGCTDGLALSLDGINYSAEATPLLIGTINSTGTTVYVKCVSAQAGVVSLILPQDGITSGASGDITSNPASFVVTSMVLSPVVSTTQVASIVADTISGTLSIMAPVITATMAGDIIVDVSQTALSAAVQAPSVSGQSNVSPSALLVTSSILAPTVSTASSLTTFNFYISGDGTLKPTATGVTAASWDSMGVPSITFVTTLFKVSAGGVETQLASVSGTVSNYEGSLSRNFTISQTALDSAGKLRLRISDGYSTANFDYSLGGLYTQINASTVVFNCDVWAFIDPEDGESYMGFGVGNPGPYRGVISRLNNVIMQ
ncbi:hypothetical protein HGB25_00325 [Candidatus Saccharibacteria bacterium]|nr:hypothetical protein [Candidatus Saccharibacteria bacterium]